VTDGYRKGIEITGVGYVPPLNGKKLQLNLGYSHPIEIDPPEGISLRGREPDRGSPSSASTRSSSARSPPGPRDAASRAVQGQGVRYAGEYIRRKAARPARSGQEVTT
jgi:large subunit ribosomal protein L6